MLSRRQYQDKGTKLLKSVGNNFINFFISIPIGGEKKFGLSVVVDMNDNFNILHGVWRGIQDYLSLFAMNDNQEIFAHANISAKLKSFSETL